MDLALEKLMGTIFWWYIIYMSVHNYHFVIGEFEYVHPKKDITDEELGIPDDSEGLAPVIPHVRSTVVEGMTQHQSFYPKLFMQRYYGDIGMWKF